MSNNDSDSKLFIKVPRGITDEPFWKKKPYSKGQVVIELLDGVTFGDRRKIEVAGKTIILNYGQLFIMKRAFSKEIGWDRKTLERFLKYLEKDPYYLYAIKQESANRCVYMPTVSMPELGTIITFLNIDRIRSK